MSDLREQIFPPNLLGINSEILRLVNDCQNKQLIIYQIRALIKSCSRLGAQIHSAKYSIDGHVVNLEVTLSVRRVVTGLRIFGKNYIGNHFIIHPGCHFTLHCEPGCIYMDHQSGLDQMLNRFDQLRLDPISHWSRGGSSDHRYTASSVARTENLCMSRIRWMLYAHQVPMFWPGDQRSDSDWSLSDNDS